MGIRWCSCNTNVVIETMLKIVLKHLSLSFFLQPNIPLKFFLYRCSVPPAGCMSLVTAYNKVQKPTNDTSRSWNSTMLETSVHYKNKVCEICFPWALENSNKRPFWTDDSQTCQNLRFKGRPEDASTRKHSKTFTYSWTTHISEGITINNHTHVLIYDNIRDKKGSYHASVHFCMSDDELSDTQTGRRGLETCVGGWGISGEQNYSKIGINTRWFTTNRFVIAGIR